MTRDPETQARDRFAIMAGFRIGGIVLMLVALWMSLGGSVAGHYGFGGVLLAVGAISALLVPQLLARRWKGPR
jgi:vacuolar-type H+-ATPase subunit I/STV1